MNAKSSRLLGKGLSTLCLSLLILHAGAANASEYSAGGKDWQASFSASYIYDDNVVETPDDASFRPAGLLGEDDGAINWTASGTYRFKYDDKIHMTADYVVDMTTQFELSAYNLTSQFFGVNPVYQVTDLISISLRSWFVYNIVNGHNFSTSFIFHPSFNHMHRKLGFTRIHYIYEHSDNIPNRARSKDRNTFGVHHTFFFSDWRHHFGFGYEFVNEEAGRAFDRRLHVFTAKLKLELPYDLDLTTNYKFTERNYDNQLGSSGFTLREDDRDKVNVKLEWEGLGRVGVAELVRLKVEYAFTSHDSNLRVRDFTTNQVIVGVDAKF